MYHSIKIIKSTYLFLAVLADSRDVTVALNFISEHTVYMYLMKLDLIYVTEPVPSAFLPVYPTTSAKLYNKI
jgi:hypothetical protein